MCGIAGFLGVGFLAPEDSRADLRGMAAALAHRGPDDEGLWSDASAGIALAHRRLSILELSPLGHQPMTSASGRYVVSFNGEIYNYRALRETLIALGHVFRGGSDTEVLLAACEQWGLAATLSRCRGMYALALWDATERTLFLARDRFGEKPLYYAEHGGFVLFGSELKALRRHRGFRAEVDRESLALFLRHGYIPAPRSIYRNVGKVLPGSILAVRRDGRGFALREESYWRAGAIEAADDCALPAGPLVEEVHLRLREAIALQMVADVPLGAFLSGGIDSSLIVALMQAASARPVRTFSIGFDEPEFNEAPHARRIARHLGTEHTELTVTARDALGVIPQLAHIYDEPFADASQIPTVLLARLTRRDVTVSLSGDAGDELFCGYGRYFEARARWERVRRLPAPLRRGAGQLLGRLPLAKLDRALRLLHPWMSAVAREDLADRVQRRARQLASRSLPEYYRSMVSYWPGAEALATPVPEPATVASDPAQWPSLASEIALLMHVDTRMYLPDDILVKVDRAAMSVGLETRVPFLDPEVAQAAWRIPLGVHLRDGRGKWVLREILARYVPPALTERPKQGFAVPVGPWLRGELREWASALLSPQRLRADGYLNAPLIERRWRQHLAGSPHWSLHLWMVLAFQAWLEETRRPCADPAELPAYRSAKA